MSDTDYPNQADMLRAEMDTLFRVSQVLSQSLNLHETLQGVLLQMHESGDLYNGMVSLLVPEKGEMILSAVHSDTERPEIRYRLGEGVVGHIMQEGRTIVINRISDEPRFLGRLGLYAEDMAFIGVPIRVSGELVGVLAAQPKENEERLLAERARFMEMLANLISQAVRLSWEVEREQRDLKRERDRLKRQVKGNYGFSNMVGHTPVMTRVFELVRQVSKWDTTVLIRGESGTGKELIANAIHYNSPRSNAPVVKLNCAALPDTLLESELFGHEKGAFTGAVAMRKGRFEQADGGTIFLDEIGEISPTFQAKLLRVLQEGEFERVGGSKTLKVNLRVIAATNRDLESAVESGDFREDLYYRLNVMPIIIPPLRERSEDIPDLASFLVNKIAKAQGRDLELTDSAIRMLMRYHWPGNVREMENTLERAAIMSEEGRIDRGTISFAGLEDRLDNVPSSTSQNAVNFDDPELDEREKVIAALEQSGWVQAKAARLLNMTPRQIAYRIQTLKIKMRRI